MNGKYDQLTLNILVVLKHKFICAHIFKGTSIYIFYFIIAYYYEYKII
jgi:hypothetical protein